MARAFANEMIRASAGTGKTYQLALRFIALAEACPRPEGILAATFARKAAGEILDRVVLRLAEAADNPQKLDELAHSIGAPDAGIVLDKSNCVRLLETLVAHLHVLRISTLDSFFVQIMGRLGLELGLPPGWSIVDDVEDQRLRLRAIREVLAEGNATETLTLLHLLNRGEVARAITDQLRAAANELYALYRETTPDAIGDQMPEAWQTIRRHKSLTREEWNDALADLESVALPDDKRFHNARTRDWEAALAEDWLRLAKGGFAKAFLEGKEKFSGKPISEDVRRVYEPILAHLKSQIVNRIADQTESTWRLLHQFHRRYQDLKIDHRAYRFDDITQILADAIHDIDNRQLAFRLDAQVEHLLLDEFQDTSLLQWNVIRPFAEASAAEAERSFFCVGDVKQAIYGWRGGVADLFSSLNEMIPDLVERELTKSYRSSQAVIDVVNQVFEHLPANAVAGKMAGAAKAWSRHFHRHTTARDLAGYCELRTAALADENEDQYAETLRFAAREVARLHRQAPGASIGVLVRRNQSVARLIYALRTEHGIEASEEGGNPLLDSAAVQLVLSLLKIADHPADRIARFHVAHSPLGEWMGFTDYASDEAAQELSLQIRRELLQHGFGKVVAEWAKGLASCCDERELARLSQLVDLAHQYESGQTLATEEFIESVSQTKLEDPSSADVRVMNIHQSKGLQFDIVVIPELDARLSGLTPPVIVGRPNPTSPIEAVFRYIASDVLSLFPDRFARMLERHNDRVDNESLCLLYVAMTRAVHALHLIIAPSKPNERSLPKSYAGLLRAALTEGQIPLPEETVLYQHGDSGWYDRHAEDMRSRVKETSDPTSIEVRFQPSTHRDRGWQRRSPSSLEGGQMFDPRKCFQSSTAGQRQGELWHAWLEQVDWLDLSSDQGIPNDEQLCRIGERYIHPQLDMQKEIADFRKALKQPEIRAALSRDSQDDLHQQVQVYQEYPIAYETDQVLTYGLVDRLVVWSEADQPVAAEVIDFKLGGAEVFRDGNVSKAGAYYEPQLQAYRTAISRVFGIAESAIRVRCLFLIAGKVWTLPEAD